MSINERIKEARKLLKLSQSEFADKIGGYSRSNISDIERGKVRPDVFFVEKLSSKFGISLTWLLKASGSMFENPSIFHNSNHTVDTFLPHVQQQPVADINTERLRFEVQNLKNKVTSLEKQLESLEKQLELKDEIIALMRNQ